jgi:hypothetical protein
MKSVLPISLSIFLTLTANSQVDSFHLYKIETNKADTSLFVTIVKSSMGYSFVFPRNVQYYYTLADTSGLDKHVLDTSRTIYGPYKFVKKNSQILFQDKNISTKFRDLYSVSNQNFLAPNLFSSSTDSYSIDCRLVDSNATVLIGRNAVSCYKFSEIQDWVYSKSYSMLYIDKKTFLPVKIEGFTDYTYNHVSYKIFATTLYK